MFTIHRRRDPAVEEDGTATGEDGFEGDRKARGATTNEKVEDQVITVATDDCSGCIGW